jgi:ER lumen protein retaining receptor
MNIFRISADMLHVVSFCIILLRMLQLKTCAGLSLKTQILYAVVFTCRYLDLFTNFYSMYNTILKILFLGCTYFIIYLCYKDPQISTTYDVDKKDTFKIEFLLAPAAILGIVTAVDWTVLEVLWTFSIYLEAVAILPQLFMLQRTGECEALNSHYIFCLGGYRALYLLNWAYRYFNEDGYYYQAGVGIVWLSGAIQTILYMDFFYYYATCVWYNKKLTLPTTSG